MVTHRHDAYAVPSQAALGHSLPIKRSETGLASVTLWGRVTALNGKVRARCALLR